MLCEDLVHSSSVANVSFDEDDLVSDDLFNTTNRFGLRVVEVIDNNYAMTSFI